MRSVGGFVMGVRIGGGIGPVSVSMSPGRATGGFFGLCWWSIVAMFKLMFWMLFACYWLLRAIYWEAPRAGWRWWQRRQAASQRP